MVRAKVRVRQAWAQVAVQLQRRHDLIPQLVAVVRGYMGHEQQLLAEVTKLRTAALQAPASERAEAEEAFGAALARLIILAEDYPVLRADKSFQRLHEQLAETEDRISFARAFANSRVAAYRQLTTTFPTNLLAGLFRFSREEMFALDDARASAAPEIDLASVSET